jgi:hypothetical protein
VVENRSASSPEKNNTTWTQQEGSLENDDFEAENGDEDRDLD